MYSFDRWLQVHSVQRRSEYSSHHEIQTGGGPQRGTSVAYLQRKTEKKERKLVTILRNDAVLCTCLWNEVCLILHLQPHVKPLLFTLLHSGIYTPTDTVWFTTEWGNSHFFEELARFLLKVCDEFATRCCNICKKKGKKTFQLFWYSGRSSKFL